MAHDEMRLISTVALAMGHTHHTRMPCKTGIASSLSFHFSITRIASFRDYLVWFLSGSAGLDLTKYPSLETKAVLNPRKRSSY